LAGPLSSRPLGATKGRMYTARCTRKVLEALHLPAVDNDQIPSTALGDWYVNFIHTRKHRLVHFVSDRSLLSVIVPVKTLKTALDRHVTSLNDLLATLGVNTTLIRRELSEMAEREVAKTRSRSVLASMRDLSLNARWILEQTPDITPSELSIELSQVPCGPLEIPIPAEATIALIKERHSGTAEGVRVA
jgi:hypothetical protein